MSTRAPASIWSMTVIETTEALYAMFDGYPLRKHVEGCPCCVGREEATRLAWVPLRALSPGDLGRYAFKAMTTWGDVTEFKHFLPRILELAVTEEGASFPGLDLELIGHKLELAGWYEWPLNERDAVLDHLRAFETGVADAGAEETWACTDVQSVIRRLECIRR